jgi:hypothetical protein
VAERARGESQRTEVDEVARMTRGREGGKREAHRDLGERGHGVKLGDGWLLLSRES